MPGASRVIPDLDGAQPRCPDDSVVMRDVPGGWACPACGFHEPVEDAPAPPAFDGPSLHGG